MDEDKNLAEFRLKLKGLLDEYGKTFHQDGAFVTAYALVAEFFDGDGQYWSSTIHDDKCPIWHVTGLIQHALENDFIEDEEED